MSVGHILLNPQRLPRATAGSADDALVQDLLAAIARVVAEPSMAADFEAALEALAERLLERAGGGLTRGLQKLTDVVRPLAALGDRIPELLGDADDPLAVADDILGLLGKLAGFAESLTIENLRAHATVFLDVLENELGLTTAAFEEEFWALLDDVAERLEATPGENRAAVASALRRIARRTKGTIHFPALDADRIASALFDTLKPHVGAELNKVACAGRAASDILGAAKAIQQLVPFTGLGSHSLGAGEGSPPPEREYLWYPSWVLGDKDIEWYQVWRANADVWIDRSGAFPVIRYRTEQLFGAETMTWTDIPIADKRFTITFKHPNADQMEKLAFHTAWGAEAIEALFHIVSPLSGVTIAKGGQVSVTDLLDAIFGTGHTVLKAAKGMPFSFLVASGDWWGRPVSWTPTVLSHLAGSFQGFHTKGRGDKNFLMWGLLLVPSDVIRAIGASSLPQLIREALLSFFTLFNYDGPGSAPDGEDTRPQNRREMDGMLAVFQFVGSLVMVKTVIARDHYGHPFTGNSTQVDDFNVVAWLEYFLLAGTLFGVANGLVGTLLTQATMAAIGSGASDWGLLGKNIGKSILKNLGLFWIYVYSFGENDTGGGTFNPVGAAFAGYPKPDASPYLLPWKGGDTVFCFQGNQGYFSHNNTNPGGSQVYAYDFMLDHGDSVRAARAGTVVDFFDAVPDNQDQSTSAPALTPGQSTTDSWNFIAIRHDAIDEVHDKGPGGGKPTTPTYALYGHGLNGSVQKVFGERTPPVAPASIIGTVVAQGDPIMLADSTGVSLCDHTHMEVRTGPMPTPGALSRGNFGPTIPFVFKDGGQPSSRSWLKSGNAS